MKHFKSIIIVQQPLEIVWSTIRDHIADLVPYLDDVAAIETQHRDEDEQGAINLVNLWRADVAIPKVASGIIDPDKLTWLDYASWQPEQYLCQWRIEPGFFSEQIKCEGSTRYEPAIGGRGTRITFEGDITIVPGELPGVPGFMQKSVASTIESFVTSLIPKNFRKVTDALSVQLISEAEPG